MASCSVYIRATKDLPLVISLNAVILPEDDLNVGHETYHWIATDKRSGEPVGFCSVSDIGHGILFLSRAGLLRSHRGRNIQRRFIKVRESFAKRNGFESIITYTLKDNYQSMSSLIKSGYKLYTPEYNYAGDDFYYFIKELL